MTRLGARRRRAGSVLEVLVQPRASRTRVVGEHDGRLKIQLAAPPVDGEANAALIEFLADALRREARRRRRSSRGETRPAQARPDRRGRPRRRVAAALLPADG